LYFECQGDWPILMECAPPLYFDPSIDICNYPDLVDCVQPSTEKPVETTTEEQDFNSTTTAFSNSTEEVTTEVNMNTTEEVTVNSTKSELPTLRFRSQVRNENVTVTCPESDDGFPVYLPHPKNCSLYFECQGDWPILMECAPPLYFDPSIDICNYPDLVDCVQPSTEKPVETTTEEQDFNSTTTEVPITTEEPTFNTTTEEIVTTTDDSSVNITDSSKLRQLPSNNSDVVCPESTDGFPVFLPHPSNCTLYYECQEDWPILMECAPPLYFDATLDVCNYQELVDCRQPTTAEPEVTTTTEPEASTTAEQEASTTADQEISTSTESEASTAKPVTVTEEPATTEEQEVSTNETSN